MYRLYIIDEDGKWYYYANNVFNFTPSHYLSAHFRTIEAANSKAHEMNLTEYFIEDEHGQTVYPIKPEVDNLNVICKTQHEQTK